MDDMLSREWADNHRRYSQNVASIVGAASRGLNRLLAGMLGRRRRHRPLRVRFPRIPRSGTISAAAFRPHGTADLD